MFPFLLFATTGLTTGYQVYRLLMLAALWGAPTSPLQYVSFLGSFALLGAAVLSLFRYRIAVQFALVFAFVIWLFYGPALIVSLQGAVSGHDTLEPLAFLPAGFLLLTTFYSFSAIHPRAPWRGAPRWLFPEKAGRRTK